jgi:hypothetical protein
MCSVLVEDFDPNRDIKSNVWAVYDGRFKTFKNRGPALNCFMRAGAAKLCELVDGRWIVRAYMPDRLLDFGQRPCDVCADRPLEALAHVAGTLEALSSYRHQREGKRAQEAGEKLYAHGHWCWKREDGKIASPPVLLFVCYSCLQRVT